MITYRQFIERFEVPSKNLKDLVKKASKRVDVDFDGDVDHNDTAYGGDYGAYVPSADGKKKLKAGPVKFAKEAFDADAEAEKLQAKREEEQEKAKARREKENQQRADAEAERQQKDDERNFVTPDDLEKAKDEEERSNGRKSFIDILKRMKG